MIRVGGHIYKFFLFIIAPVFVMIIAESCSKMESSDGSLSGMYSSDTNVCSAQYDPTIQLKSSTQKVQAYVDPFENQKVHLSSKQLSKTTGSLQDQDLKDQTVMIVLHSQCSPTANSLSDHVLKANPNEELLPTKHAFFYKTTEPWDLETLESAANADPCIVSVTPPDQVSVSKLELPVTSDTSLAKMDHLAFTNYAHAYEYFVKKQNGIYAHVGLVDTGVECSHPDLVANLIANCGYNLINTNQLPLDVSSGHGTHVGGLIGAVANNNLGTLGVAGNVRIHAFKVLSDTATDASYSVNGIRYAITQNVDVINLSLTGTDPQQRILPLEQAVADAVSAGIVVIMAAGNHALRLGTDAFVSPAMAGNLLSGALAVGSIDANSGRLSTFSNFGDQVEIAAPGAINSYSNGTAITGLYSLAPGRSYQRLMGTSQAAPIVTAAAALVIQFLKQRSIPYSPGDIEDILVHSTDSVPILVEGGRSLNFSKLVRNTYEYAGINLCP